MTIFDRRTLFLVSFVLSAACVRGDKQTTGGSGGGSATSGVGSSTSTSSASASSSSITTTTAASGASSGLTGTTGHGTTSSGEPPADDTGAVGEPFGCDVPCDCDADSYCLEVTEGNGAPGGGRGSCRRNCVSTPECDSDDICTCLSESQCPSFGECTQPDETYLRCSIPGA